MKACHLLLLAVCATAPARQGAGPLFVQGGAGRLRVSDGGSGGIAVVFHHGLGSDWTCWQG